LSSTPQSWHELGVNQRAELVAFLDPDDDLADLLDGECLIEDLFDPHPDTDEEVRICVDVSRVNYAAPERVAAFLTSSGLSAGSETRLGHELRQYRSDPELFAQFGDLGLDMVTESKFETFLYERAVNELGDGAESQEVERLMQMGCSVAWITTYNLDLIVGDISRRVQLIKVLLNSGDVFYALPWDAERDLMDQIGGEWVEIDREPIQDPEVDWSTIRGPASAFKNEPGVDDAMREVWGDEFELPEVGAEESLPEADEWRRQLSEEFGDEPTDDDSVSPENDTNLIRGDEADTEGLDWDLPK
jgi:hypothetical protein